MTITKLQETFENMSKLNPADYVKLQHDGHTIITYWGNCTRTPAGKINWEKSLRKKIEICRDGVVKTFKILEYIKHPTPTAHDGKIRVLDMKTKQEYLVWSRDFKQGDIAKLFKNR